MRFFRPSAALAIATLLCAHTLGQIQPFDSPPAAPAASTPAAETSAPPKVTSAPDSPLTERKLYDLWQDYEYQAMIGTYKKSSFTDPRWDGKVDELYRIAAKNYAQRAPQSPRQVELLSHLQNGGCKDPLVTWMIIASKTQSNIPKSKLARSIEDCEEALGGLIKANYSKIRQWRLNVYILTLKQNLGEDRSQLANWTSCCEDALVGAASEPNLSPIAERLIFEKFQSDMNGSTKCYSRALCDKLKASTASDWLKGCIAGEFHVKEAWNLRGSGWASEVNEAGWQGFASELNEAHDAYLAAYTKDPSRPEPATGLMTVVAASSAFPNESPALWFDRATKAQFDFADAYVTRRWFLRPRWGGSHEAALKLASDWVASNRFDTRVPEMYLWTLDDIAQDRGEYQTIWNDPGVLKMVERLRDGYLEQKDPYFNTILSRIANMLWLAGRYAEAKDLVDKLKDGFVPWAGSVVCLAPKEFAAVHAYATEIRSAALAADAAAETRDYDKSVSLLTEALAANDKLPDEVRSAANQKIALFKFRKSLNDHQWTSLILGDSPELFFDDGQIPKAWEFTKDSITLTAKNSWWGEFRFLPKVGTRYEMRSRITVPADGQSDKCRAGFIVNFNFISKYPFWQSVILAPFQKSWTTGDRWNRDDTKPMEAGNPADLLVKVWDDEIVIKIDGVVVYAGSTIEPDRAAPIRDQVGFCVVDHDPASGPVAFAEPAIRLLQSRPTELAKEERPVRRRRPVEEPKPRF